MTMTIQNRMLIPRLLRPIALDRASITPTRQHVARWIQESNQPSANYLEAINLPLTGIGLALRTLSRENSILSKFGTIFSATGIGSFLLSVMGLKYYSLLDQTESLNKN